MNPALLRVQLDRDFFGEPGTLVDFMGHSWSLVEPGRKFVRTRHIECLAEHLEAVSRCEIENLIINIPPGCMKSLSTCIFWPTWEWVARPATSFMFTSYDQGMTVKQNIKARRILESSWFQARWGDRFRLHGGEKSFFQNDKGGFRMATSVGGKATGYHPDIKVIDDPQKPKDTNSEKARDNVNAWAGETMATRGMTVANQREVIIMQRLHENDLVGYLTERDPGKYVHLRLPMEFDPRRACVTVLGGDWRTEPGELLCPELVTAKKVAELKRSLGATAASAQLDQDPTPADGQIFKVETFKYVRRRDLPDHFDMIVQTWDCTFKGEETSDFVAGQVWGISGADFYLLDEFHERVDFVGTCAALAAMLGKWPDTVATLIEDKANGTAVMNVLGKKLPGLVPVTPEGGKVARAHAVTPLFDAGNVHFIAPVDAAWVDELVDELKKFPKGKHDDRVDSLTQGLVYMQSKVVNLTEALAGLGELADAFR